MTLNLSDTLSLPLDYVTKTAAILAQRRKGKTYTASVIAEELTAASQPWVALDPTGAWWGLRASADGESAGLPVVILGGQHGDAPLERTAGRYVAELVVESPGWYVLDLSLFDSRAAEREFATDFAEALIRRKRQPGRDFPMHLFVDEADMFAPQEKETGDQRMLGAYQAIVRRGGLHGLGSTLILAQAEERAHRRNEEASTDGRQDIPRAGSAGRDPGPVAHRAPERSPQRADPQGGRDRGRAAVPGSAVPAGPGSLLRVLAGRYPAWLTRRQIVTLARRGPKSSALDGHFDYLRVNGLAMVADGTWRATEAGLAAVGGRPADDPIEAWHGAFSGATQKVFDALVAVYPERYTKDGIADLAGLSRTSSSVGAALSELRRNGLIEEYPDGIQAGDILFENPTPTDRPTPGAP